MSRLQLFTALLTLSLCSHALAAETFNCKIPTSEPAAGANPEFSIVTEGTTATVSVPTGADQCEVLNDAETLAQADQWMKNDFNLPTSTKVIVRCKGRTFDEHTLFYLMKDKIGTTEINMLVVNLAVGPIAAGICK